MVTTTEKLFLKPWMQIKDTDLKGLLLISLKTLLIKPIKSGSNMGIKDAKLDMVRQRFIEIVALLQ